MAGATIAPRQGSVPRRIGQAPPLAPDVARAIESRSICDVFGFEPGHFAARHAEALLAARAFTEHCRTGGLVHDVRVAAVDLQASPPSQGGDSPRAVGMASAAEPTSEGMVDSLAPTTSGSSTNINPRRKRNRSLMPAGLGFAAVAGRLRSGLVEATARARGVLPRRRRAASQRVHPTFEALVPAPVPAWSP